MFDFAFNAQRFAVYLIPTLLGIIMHEVAHGWMASRKGDQTARFMGRLTLNPVSHFDALGAAVFLLTSLGTGFIFGWAKPVPVNVRNLRDPARDMMWVALAGPVTNFLLAIGFALVLGAVVAMLPSPDISDTTRYFLLMLVAGVKPEVGARNWAASIGLTKPKVESEIVKDNLTVAAPPGAVILSAPPPVRNEFGEFVMLKYYLPIKKKEEKKGSRPPRRRKKE